MKPNKGNHSFALTILVSLAVVMSIAANIISGRLGFFGPFVAPMGVFFFPFIFILSDVVGDVYGYRVNRWMSWTALGANLLFVALILVVINVIQPAPWVIPQDQAIRLLLIGGEGTSGMIRIVIAGVIAATIGMWMNDIVFQKLRHRDGIMKFMRRKFASSAVGEAIDTILFITIAFVGVMPFTMLLQMYVVQFILKYGVEVVTAPLARWGARYVRSIEGEEAFEDRNRFNIFGFEKKS